QHVRVLQVTVDQPVLDRDFHQFLQNCPQTRAFDEMTVQIFVSPRRQLQGTGRGTGLVHFTQQGPDGLPSRQSLMEIVDPHRPARNILFFACESLFIPSQHFRRSSCDSRNLPDPTLLLPTPAAGKMSAKYAFSNPKADPFPVAAAK